MKPEASKPEEGSERTRSVRTSTGKRCRLLFLCQTLPFPPDGGVHIRAFHLLRQLSKHYEVTALCFYRRATRPTDEDVSEGTRGLRVHADLEAVEAFPIDHEHSHRRFAWDHGRSLVTQRAYTVFTYESRQFRSRLRQLLSEEKFDLVHVDSLDLSGYLREFEGIPVVCDHHNVESSLLQRRSTQESNPFRRAYVRLQADLTKKEEEKWCERVPLNLSVSSEDADLLRLRAPRCITLVVPNGVDTDGFKPAYDGDQGLVFVGGHTWFPNRDGMEFFAERILPRLRELRKATPVRWVGRAPVSVIKEYGARFGIELTGYVDDIRPYVQPAACFIVPLRVGGGTRLKILDAWAMGKAVVSTSLGCEGLDAQDGENILVRDTEEDFAKALHQVLEDPELRTRLGKAGRHTVENTYDWDVVGKGMLDAYAALIPEWLESHTPPNRL